MGFLVKNYPCSLIPRSKLANPGQNTSNIVFKTGFATPPSSRIFIGSLGYSELISDGGKQVE